MMLPQLQEWDRLSPAEQEAAARGLLRELPEGFAPLPLRSFELGGVSRRVAQFQQGAAVFSLVPGGPVTLGYNTERPWAPNPDEWESWQDSAEEYEIPFTLAEYLAEVTRRPRTVELAPLLVETVAAEPGWAPVSPEDPRVRERVREWTARMAGPCETTGPLDEGMLRVRRGADGSVTVELAPSLTHAGLSATLPSPFRFPTSDEWEHLCGAGAPTLFRWGDHVPCDRYPTDDGTPEWDFHRRPNAFGLHIAQDPYHYELVAEPGIYRGGDGGCNICGGIGFFMGWIPLATAYFDRDASQYDPAEPLMLDYTVARRVLPLAG